MITCKPRFRSLAKNIVLQASNYTIQQSTKIKILGVYFTSGMDNTPNVNNIIQKVSFRMHVLKGIIKFTNIKTSLILYNSLIISVFNYCLSNLININSRQVSKLHTLLMKCAHNVLGYPSYKLNTTTILGRLNWLSFPQMVIFDALKLVHKVSFEGIPLALTQYLHYNMERTELVRLVRRPSASHRFKSAQCKNSFIHRSIFIYNSLPFNFITLNKKKFAKELKDYI